MNKNKSINYTVYAFEHNTAVLILKIHATMSTVVLILSAQITYTTYKNVLQNFWI